MSATGEALKKELVAALVRRPARDHAGQRLRADRDLGRHEPRGHGPGPRRATGSRSGRPVQNVHVYVVDEHLVPVPLGAPGEIVFSGVCVGRGYVNDPERTRPVFLADPHRAGRAALPERRLRPLAARRQAGVPRPPGHPGQDLAASGSRSARSRTRCCGCPASATAPWWSPSGADRGKHLVAFYAGARAARGRRAAGAAGRVAAASTWCPSAFHWRDKPAADRQRQDRHEGADGARRRARRRRGGQRRAAHADRAAAGGRLGHRARRPRGPDRPARPLLRPRRHVAVGGEAGDRPGARRCRSRTSPATRSWPTWPR